MSASKTEDVLGHQHGAVSCCTTCVNFLNSCLSDSFLFLFVFLTDFMWSFSFV